MQLYKNRTFGDYFSDTFGFLKTNGKHFYKNYFTVNGIFLLTLMVLMFFFGKFYSSMVFSGFDSTGSGDPMTNFLDENPVLFLVFAFLFIILIILFSAFNYAYTPIYFLLYEQHQNSNGFSRKEIVNAIKSNLGKLFIYLLAGLLMSVPVLIGVGIAAVILTVTLIGILALPLLFAWVAQFYFIAFITYLKEDKGIFDCFSYAFNLSFKDFWAANGSVALFYIMIQVAQTIITMIPYLIGIASLVSGYESSGSTDGEEPLFVMMMTAVYMLSFLLNLFLMTVLQTNQSIIYFSLKEQTENINTKSIIDEIGNA